MAVLLKPGCCPLGHVLSLAIAVLDDGSTVAYPRVDTAWVPQAFEVDVRSSSDLSANESLAEARPSSVRRRG